MSETLPEFLLARITEDEAEAPLVATAHEWRLNRTGYWQTGEPPTGVWLEVRVSATETSPRVLAECEAKRRIVGRFEGASRHPEQECGCTGSPDEHWADVDAWATLCDLATPYADHPDYRDEWRP